MVHHWHLFCSLVNQLSVIIEFEDWSIYKTSITRADVFERRSHMAFDLLVVAATTRSCKQWNSVVPWQVEISGQVHGLFGWKLVGKLLLWICSPRNGASWSRRLFAVTFRYVHTNQHPFTLYCCNNNNVTVVGSPRRGGGRAVRTTLSCQLCRGRVVAVVSVFADMRTR